VGRKLEVLRAQVGCAAASMAGAAPPLITVPTVAKANAMELVVLGTILALSSQRLHLIICSSIVTMAAARPRGSTPMTLS
jgi:hypothetical protein